MDNIYDTLQGANIIYYLQNIYSLWTVWYQQDYSNLPRHVIQYDVCHWSIDLKTAIEFFLDSSGEADTKLSS